MKDARIKGHHFKLIVKGVVGYNNDERLARTGSERELLKQWPQGVSEYIF